MIRYQRRQAINVLRAKQLLKQKLTAREIGRRLARETGREIAFSENAVRNAVRKFNNGKRQAW